MALAGENKRVKNQAAIVACSDERNKETEDEGEPDGPGQTKTGVLFAFVGGIHTIVVWVFAGNGFVGVTRKRLVCREVIDCGDVAIAASEFLSLENKQANRWPLISTMSLHSRNRPRIVSCLDSSL